MDMHKPRTPAEMREIALEVQSTKVVEPYLASIENAARNGLTHTRLSFQGDPMKNEAYNELGRLGYRMECIEWCEEFLVDVCW